MTGGIVLGGAGVGCANMVSKPADTIRNNTNVLADDPDLFFTVEANSIYLVFLFLRFDVKTASAFRYNFSAPAGASMVGPPTEPLAAVWPASFALDTELDLTNVLGYNILAFGGDTVKQMAPVVAFVITGATPGTVTFRWCQGTAVLEDTTVYRGSTIAYRKVA